MSSFRVTLFYGIHVQIDGQPITLAYDKVRALLAYLLLENRQPHRLETLAGLLWPIGRRWRCSSQLALKLTF